jgi:hypothetical protein
MRNAVNTEPELLNILKYQSSWQCECKASIIKSEDIFNKKQMVESFYLIFVFS